MSQRIVFINQDSGYLIIDIINTYAEAGYECTLLSGRLVERNNKLHPSVRIDKIIRYNRGSSFKRLLTWFWAFVQIVVKVKVKIKYRGAFLFIVTNPPFATLLPLFCKNKYSLLVYDVYPDALTVSNILPVNSLLVKLWQKSNIKVYARSEKLFTLSDGMRTTMDRYARGKEIEVVPVWTDNHFLKPLAKADNPFIAQHRLQDQFIVLYSGNMGMTHSVEVIPELAAMIQNTDILFLIIGEGDKKSLIKEKIESLQLSNCRLLPLQETRDLPYSLASADVAIVTLGSGSSHLSIPSKTYNLMSVGVPLLCIAAADSALSELVNTHQIGRCFEALQLDEMKEYILELYREPVLRKQYSENALKASLLFTAENAGRFVH